MSWGRIDDGMLEHRKWIRIEAEHGARAWADCLAVWTAALLYAHRARTDGAVPIAWLSRGTPLGKVACKAAEVLVSVGLFERTADGYQIHDFADYGLSREERERRAEATRERVARFRAKRSGNGVTPSDGNAVGNASPDPTRPDQRSLPGSVGAKQVARAPEGPAHSLTRDAETIRKALADAFEAAAVRPAPAAVRDLGGKPWVALVEPLREIAARERVPLERVAARLGAGFLASPRARKAHYPIVWLVANPGEYLAPSGLVSDFSHVDPSVDAASQLVFDEGGSDG